MPIASTSTPELLPEVHPPRIRSKRGLAVGCVIVAVLGVCVISYQVIRDSRDKIVGITDPKSGYRIVYTVSSRYLKSQVQVKPNVRSVEEADDFTLKPPPQAIQWIYAHVLHEPASLASSNPVLLVYSGLMNSQSAERQGISVDGHGYPYWDQDTTRRYASTHTRLWLPRYLASSFRFCYY
jgi:hypothetical protein